MQASAWHPIDYWSSDYLLNCNDRVINCYQFQELAGALETGFLAQHTAQFLSDEPKSH
jgi:hypothetical protein